MDPSTGIPQARQGHGRGAAMPALLLLAASLGLAGCAGQGISDRLNFSSPRPATATTPPPVSTDPVIAAAARARPGQDERVTLENGQAATVRVVRVYQAASGRECREVVVGAGLDERPRLICGAETGWTEARPLLRGGAGQR
jgi:hypothetical protein